MTLAAGAKPRVPLWDNARWVAVVLVVIGHAILPLVAESDTAYSLYLGIYSFHVALFVIVAGYFTKATPPTIDSMRGLLRSLVFPYLIFETIWTLIRGVLGGSFRFDYTVASWTLWFLLALAIWRVLLPYLMLLRFPLLIAIALSVAAGYFDSIDESFALSRTIGMLPYFVFGFKLKEWAVSDRWLSLHPAAVVRWRIGALALFGGWIALLLTQQDFGRWLRLGHFMFVADPYAEFGRSEWWAGGARLAVLLLAIVFSSAFLLLMPRRHTFFSAWGAATLYIYLLHTFFLFPLREFGWLEGPQPWWLLWALIALAVGIAVLLSQPWVMRLFRPLVEPRANWLFAKRDETLRTATLPLDGGRGSA